MHTGLLHFAMAIIQISFKVVSLPMMATSKYLPNFSQHSLLKINTAAKSTPQT